MSLRSRRLSSTRSWYLGLLLVVSLPGVSLAQAPRFGLAPGEPPKPDVVAVVRSDFVVAIDLTVAKTGSGSATLSLSSFRSADKPAGPESKVGFAPDGAPPTADGKLVTTRTIKLDKRGVRLRLDASRVTIGEDLTVKLTIQPSKGDRETLTIRIQWKKPEIFQRNEHGVKASAASAIEISDGGLGLALLDLGGFRSKPVDLITEPFLSSGTGNAVRVRLDLATTKCASKAEGQSEGGPLRLTPAPHCNEIPIVVDGRALTPGTSYRGFIEVSHASGARHRRAYTVTRAAVSQAAVPVVTGTTVEEHTCFWGCTPSIRLTLGEKTHRLPLRVISIKPVGTEASGLGSSAKLDASLAARSTIPIVSDLWNVDGGDTENLAQRSLGVGDQATLVFEPKERLYPGEYKAKIQLQAENVELVNQPTIELTFRVAQHWGVPLDVLIFSVLVSYAIGRGIKTRQRHRKLRDAVKKHIKQGEHKAFKSSSPPVVHVRAELARIREALGRSKPIYRWVSVPTNLEERLAIVERRLPTLDRIADISNYWKNPTQASVLVRRRAERFLRDTIQDLTETPEDGDFSPKVLEKLDELKRWEEPGRLTELYWLHLKPDIVQLKSRIVLRGFSEGPDETKLGELVGDLLDGFGKLEAAAASIHALDDEIAKAKGSGTDVSNLHQILAVDPQRFATLSQSLQAVGEQLDQAKAKGLQGLADAANKTADLLAARRVDAPWRDIAGITSQLENLPGSSAQEAIELVGELAGRADNWLEVGLAALQSTIEAGASTERERIRRLLSGLESDQLPADIHEVEERERKYAALKLIWERRGVKELESERRKLTQDSDLRLQLKEFFDAVDDWAWQNMKGQLEISQPRAGRTLEELTLIEFEISPRDRSRGDNFLFKHGLEYHWKIYAGENELQKNDKPLLEPVTQEPRVVQFIPAAYSKLHVECDVVRRIDGGEPQEYSATTTEFSTVESEELKWRRSFQRGELLALAAAGFVAVVPGMSTVQFTNTLMGSFETYVALVAWGIAAERGSKLLKDFDSYSPG